MFRTRVVLGNTTVVAAFGAQTGLTKVESHHMLFIVRPRRCRRTELSTRRIRESDRSVGRRENRAGSNAMERADRDRLLQDVEAFCRALRPVEERCYLERRFKDHVVHLEREHGAPRGKGWRSRWTRWSAAG